MAAPTFEEEHLLSDFRERVKDVLETEQQKQSSFLIRWLRARDLDLNEAEKMFRFSLVWRKANGINHILEVPLDNYFQQELPYYITGVDKLGHPVVVIPMGKWDFRNCVAQKTTEEITHFVNYCFENVCRAIENANQGRDPNLYPVTQFTLIADWKGYSYMQLCSLKAVQNILYAARLFEVHYPEIAFRSLLINCPSFFNILMTMIKQVLPIRTYEKITVCGNNREEWEQICREIIDNHQLSEIFKLLC